MMAKGFDALLEFLLDAIALRGENGKSFAQQLCFVLQNVAALIGALDLGRVNMLPPSKLMTEVERVTGNEADSGF